MNDLLVSRTLLHSKKLKKFNSKSKYPEQKTEFSAISLFFRHGNSETIMAETLLY